MPHVRPAAWHRPHRPKPRRIRRRVYASAPLTTLWSARGDRERERERERERGKERERDREREVNKREDDRVRESGERFRDREIEETIQIEGDT